MGTVRAGALAPLTGLVAVVLLVLAASLSGTGGYQASPDEIMAALADPGRAAVGIYLGDLAVFFMIWFTACLDARIRRPVDAGRTTSVVTLGGGLIAAASLGVALAASSAIVLRARTAEGIEVAGAVALNDLRSALLGEAFPVGPAAMVAGVGYACIRKGFLPAWFGWLSLAVALLSLSPLGFVGLAAAALWITVISIWLTARGAIGQPGQPGPPGPIA